jgi:hypothetical protein
VLSIPLCSHIVLFSPPFNVFPPLSSQLLITPPVPLTVSAISGPVDAGSVNTITVQPSSAVATGGITVSISCIDAATGSALVGTVSNPTLTFLAAATAQQSFSFTAPSNTAASQVTCSFTVSGDAALQFRTVPSQTFGVMARVSLSASSSTGGAPGSASSTGVKCAECAAGAAAALPSLFLYALLAAAIGLFGRQ